MIIEGIHVVSGLGQGRLEGLLLDVHGFMNCHILKTCETETTGDLNTGHQV